jgi:hypothetical protein
MKVSFDFDSTLSRSDVQDFATSLVQLGHEVWIVTSRFSNEVALESRWHWIPAQNDKLFGVAQKCGIPTNQIIFTNMVSKSKFLEGFLFHLDDDEIELEDIIEWSVDCKGVDVSFDDWREKCLNILNECS